MTRPHRGDNLRATTWVAWEEHDPREDDYVTREVEVSWEFTPTVPARISGPPESCYPAEGGELVRCEIRGMEVEGDKFLQHVLGDSGLEAAIEAALAQAEREPEEER